MTSFRGGGPRAVPRLGTGPAHRAGTPRPETTQVTGTGTNLGHGANPENNQPRGAVSVRLSRRWGVKPATAHWLTYGMERGIRGRCLDIIAELGPDADAWFAPVMERLSALRAQTQMTLTAKVRIDFEENLALEAFRADVDGDVSDTRRVAYLALEKEAAACLALAGQTEGTGRSRTIGPSFFEGCGAVLSVRPVEVGNKHA